MAKKRSKDQKDYIPYKKQVFPLLFLLLIGGAIAVTTITDTTIDSGNITAENLYFGNTNGTGNATLPERPFTSNSVRTINVDAGGGGDFLTIQEAINQVPYMLRHMYIINISTGVYNEDLRIPPVLVSDIIRLDEGSVEGLRIRGNVADINAVQVNSIHIISPLGS
ncbi:hypothetical protein LCGC14_2697810, partial [marine sediment metagenome]